MTETDLISRQAAIEVAKQYWYKPDIAGALAELPSAEPERKKGNEKCSNKLPCGWCSLFDTPCFGRGVNRMDDLISRQAALDALTEYWKGISDRHPTLDGEMAVYADCKGIIKRLSSAQPEQLTDKEQRIFLAAMGREEKVCKQVDDEYRDCMEPYEDSLVRICHEITRKIKGALWNGK